MAGAAYQVGQVLYVVSPDHDHVVPMRVCEEIRRRTVAGEVVTYLVNSGPEARSFDLAEANGKVFATLDEAKDHLRENFEAWLGRQVEWTLNAQKAWYEAGEP